MAQPLSTSHQTRGRKAYAGRSLSGVSLACAGVAGLVALGMLALWYHYGSAVFFETIRAGFAACF